MPGGKVKYVGFIIMSISPPAGTLGTVTVIWYSPEDLGLVMPYNLVTEGEMWEVKKLRVFEAGASVYRV